MRKKKAIEKNYLFNKELGKLRLYVERMNQRIKIFKAARRWN